jgi:hypothetical protein
MHRRGVVVLIVITGLFWVAGAFSQTQTSDPGDAANKAEETQEQRLERMGVQEDPGLNPDPEREWFRFGRRYKILRFEKRFAAYDQPKGYVRPMANVGIPAEIYREDDTYVWVWLPMYDEAPTAEEIRRRGFFEYKPEQLEYLNKVAVEFVPIKPLTSEVKIVFEESSQGLPQRGSWRNSLDVADFNNDGFLDIVTPPERGAPAGVPAIFLGNGKGQWQFWESAIFSDAIDYGSVTAADLNKDGKIDIVAGVHLLGVRAFLGDGKGNFTSASKGLEADFPTRRVTVADVDRDGDLDIVALFEGPTPGPMQESSLDKRKLKVFLNDGRARMWTALEVDDANRMVAGDWLAVANLNGDRLPDFVGSSIYFHGADLFWLSDSTRRWKPFGRDFLPFWSYYFALTSGKFTGRKTDDAVLSFYRIWPADVDPEFAPTPPAGTIVGLELVSDLGGKPVRKVIAAWDSQWALRALASGDFDGDGRLDLIYTRQDTQELKVLLGDGKGNFREAQVEGGQIPGNSIYDLKVADVNKDGRPDLLFMYETSERSMVRDGAIRVLLNRTAAAKGKKNRL